MRTVIWVFSWSHLLAHRAAHAPSLHWKWWWRMLLLTPGGQQGQQKLWCSHDIVYRGQENRPLAREQAGLLGSLSSTDSHCPRASSSMGDQPETADRHAWVSVPDPQRYHSVRDPLKGAHPNDYGGYAGCIPHLGTGLLGRVVEFATILPHQSVLRDQSQSS